MESFYCRLKRDEEIRQDIIGIAVSDHIVTVLDQSAPGGVRTVPQIGVIWFSETEDDDGNVTLEPSNAPAPSYHVAQELVALGLVSDNTIEDVLGLEDSGDDDDFVASPGDRVDAPSPEANA